MLTFDYCADKKSHFNVLSHYIDHKWDNISGEMSQYQITLPD